MRALVLPFYKLTSSLLFSFPVHSLPSQLFLFILHVTTCEDKECKDDNKSKLDVSFKKKEARMIYFPHPTFIFLPSFFATKDLKTIKANSM